MFRKRIATLAVAATVSFGATAVDTPVASAEPLPSLPAVLGSAESLYKEAVIAVIKMLMFPLGLSSLVLAQFAPRELVCDGLVPRFCTEEELEHRRTAPRV